jgi:hypothetical protein
MRRIDATTSGDGSGIGPYLDGHLSGRLQFADESTARPQTENVDVRGDSGGPLPDRPGYRSDTTIEQTARFRFMGCWSQKRWRVSASTSTNTEKS